MSGTSCELYPKVNNGEDSLMYKDLLKLTSNRPITNLIYAYYLQLGVDALMDNEGYSRNKLGQHTAKDVFKFFDVLDIINQSTEASVTSAERRIGAKDSMGNYIDFDDANLALDKVTDFNELNTALVATVIPRGNLFRILVQRKDSRTQKNSAIARELKDSWALISSWFNDPTYNLDLDFILLHLDIRSIANPITSHNSSNGRSDFLSFLNNLSLTDNRYLTKNDILMLLGVNQKHSVLVLRLLLMFGDIDTAALEVYDILKGNKLVTLAVHSLIGRTLDNCKKFNGLNMARLNNIILSLNQLSKASSLNNEYSVLQTLDDLNKKYDIDIDEINLIGERMSSLRQVAANAITSLLRQLNKVSKQTTNLSQSSPYIKRLLATISQLASEILSKKYYMGCINFLGEANNLIVYIERLLQLLPLTGSTMVRARESAKILLEIKGIKDAYYDIINTLCNIDNLTDDEGLNDADKTTLKREAEKIKKSFDNYERKLKELRREIVLEVAIDILGDTTANGLPIANILEMLENDGSIFDNVYSFTKMSNPLISLMGRITRDALDLRDKQLQEINVRISRATKRLYDAGYDTKFMYGSDGYIISDIDWILFNKDRKAAKMQFKLKGLKGVDFDLAMQLWDEAHTEDRIVDYLSGRTEKVPDIGYRTTFPDLSPELLEYYDTMMQIKGEIGTLMPEYMQKLYLPPQLRRSFMDAIGNAKGIRDIIKAVALKVGDFFKIREDDTYYASNAVIDGDEYAIGLGNFSNEPLRTIPIFFVRKIKDLNELLKDFSGGLLALAGTAINYYHMLKVIDLVEMIGDYTKELPVAATKNGNKMMELVKLLGLLVSKLLNKVGALYKCSELIEGMIAKLFYGQHSINGDKWWDIVGRNLIKYTSIKSLSVNVKGMINNLISGNWQVLIEAGAGKYFNYADYVWAVGKMLGETATAPGKLLDFLTNSRHSYDVLLSDIFDPDQSNYFSLARKRYYKSAFRKLFGIDYTFAGYGIGEYILHKAAMYAQLHHIKVLDENGKKISLYDAYEKDTNEDGITTLKLKDGVTDLQGNPIGDEFIDLKKREMRSNSQGMFGAMNDEDKGILGMKLWGASVMNLRLWMVAVYSKFFRGEYIDAATGEKGEGIYRTVGKLLLGYAKDIRHLNFALKARNDELEDYQKENIRRAIALMVIIGSLNLLAMALGEPEDHKKEFWYRMWIWQTLRSLSELGMLTPWSIWFNFREMANSPIPATSTINGFLYPIFGINDITETYKRGKHKGENKYLVNTMRYTVPFYKQLESLYYMDEDESAFSIFDSSQKFR